MRSQQVHDRLAGAAPLAKFIILGDTIAIIADYRLEQQKRKEISQIIESALSVPGLVDAHAMDKNYSANFNYRYM